MARGKPGADSSTPVTSQIDGKTLIEIASDLFSATPVFWGRYFTSISTTGNVEYRHAEENLALRENGIRVLPIARQTVRVNGTEDAGEADGQANATDILATFGEEYLRSQGGSFYVFLDVEGTPHLSSAYFRGWARGLSGRSSDASGGTVVLRPCLYATQGDNTTWSAMAAAVNAGADCKGVWVARWTQRGCNPLSDWNDQLVIPTVAIPCPVLAWQYSDECHGTRGFDCSQTNPAIDLDQDLLSHLILPPLDQT